MMKKGEVFVFSFAILLFVGNILFFYPVAEIDAGVKDEVVDIKKISFKESLIFFGKKNMGAKFSLEVSPKNADMDGLKIYTTNTKIAKVKGDNVVTSTGFGECKLIAKYKTGSGKVIKDKVRVVCKNKWIALTFDDGPNEWSKKMFKAIKKENVFATVFYIGRSIKGKKKYLKQVAESGLVEIGNHSYTHNYYANLYSEIKQTDKLVKSYIGKKTSLVRPPGVMIKSAKLAKKPIILWSVDPRDWATRSESLTYERVKAQAKSGSIVLMHDIYPSTYRAAKRLIKYYKKNGYFLVTVAQILGGNPKGGTVYTKGSETPKSFKVYK